MITGHSCTISTQIFHCVIDLWPLPQKVTHQKGHLNSWDLCIASTWPLCNREKWHYESKRPESGFVVILHFNDSEQHHPSVSLGSDDQKYSKKNHFQHHYFSFQCHMIFQKSFECADLLLMKHSLLLSMLKTVVLLNIFVETDIFFMILLWIKSRKEQHLIKTEISCCKCLYCHVW